MPLIYNHSINNYTKIGVWHITEAEDFFFEKFSLQQTITHPHKRLQHLAGRHLLSILFPSFPTELIKIASTKKPFLEDEAFHFSISHCGDYAAAIVSTNNRVGVDIETPHHKIERIQHKFITPQEQVVLQNFSTNIPQMLTMAWSIKEAIFKWYGLGQVDFKKHIQIQSLATIDNEIVAHCTFLKHTNVKLAVKNIILQGNNLSWVVS
jgi:phosphopantetheinyl transferase